jgi:hypothetical protein
MKSALERFCDNIVVEPNTGCHLWSGNSDKNGYGKIYVDRQHLRAHRFSYKIFNGEATKDCLICHKCDTPACVNPEHLFIGTPKENMQDKIRKGRLKISGLIAIFANVATNSPKKILCIKRQTLETK